jgi:hypothetical protein
MPTMTNPTASFLCRFETLKGRGALDFLVFVVEEGLGFRVFRRLVNGPSGRRIFLLLIIISPGSLSL